MSKNTQTEDDLFCVLRLVRRAALCYSRDLHTPLAWKMEMMRLSKAELLIRQDRPREALEALGGGDAPPKDVPRRQRPVWYALAGWALALDGQANDALRVLERGMQMAEALLVRAPRSRQASLAELVERLRCYQGMTYCTLGQTGQALALHRRGLVAIGQKIILDPELKLLIYKGLGNEALALGQFQDAIFFYELAARQADDLNTDRQQGLTYWGLGLAYQQSGDLLRARASYEQALAALERHGNRQLLTQMRSIYGQLLSKLGHHEEAEQMLHICLAVARYFGDVRTCGMVLVDLVELSIFRGETDQAIEEAREALPMLQESGERRGEGQLHLTLAAAYEARQDATRTEQEFKEALRLFQQIGNHDMIRLAHERYAYYQAHQGNFQEAYTQMRLAYMTPIR